MPDRAIAGFRGEYEFLSNFYEAPVAFRWPEGQGIWVWPTNEHAFQAHKMATLADRRAVAQAPTALRAKQIGRARMKRDGWDRDRKRIMLEINLAKFTQHPGLAARLVATGNARLIELNRWHDNEWGDCGCGQRHRFECARPGKNWLGQILMMVRFALRND